MGNAKTTVETVVRGPHHLGGLAFGFKHRIFEKSKIDYNQQIKIYLVQVSNLNSNEFARAVVVVVVIVVEAGA